MKRYGLCIAFILLPVIISSCTVLPTLNANSPITTITPIPTKSYILPSDSPTVSTSFPLLPTASNNNHPFESPSAFPTSSIQPTASADSDMINEQKDFKFGMSRKSVEKELKKLGIKIIDDESVPAEAPEGFSTISTDNFEFDLNDQDQLYSITEYGGETTKGLRKGDPMEKIQQLYGNPDEYPYVYRCNGYMFSVNIDSSNDTVNCWSVFLNIWNDLDSYGITKAMYTGDNSIQFNEDNFDNCFTFGMSRIELKKKLIEFGIRIDLEEDLQIDGGGWEIDTDHVKFIFDKKQHLYFVEVDGWETAKELQIGDSVEKLHQLYGKENGSNDGGSIYSYTYNKEGYKLEVSFYKSESDVFGLHSWFIFTK